MMNIEAPFSCRGNGLFVAIEAIEFPAALAIIAEDVEVKAIATTDIQNAGILRQAACPRPKPAEFQLPTNGINEPEMCRVKLERVIVVRIDPRRFFVRRSRIEKQHAAFATSHHQERVAAGAVFEVLPHGDGIDILEVA